MRRASLVLAGTLVLCLGAVRSPADIMDGINQNAATASGLIWAGTEVGWFYTPSTSYYLSGIDTRFASADGRTVTLEFFKNGPRADAGWELLGTADMLTQSSPTWSVGTFSTPISLTAGGTYFVGFRNTQQLPADPGPGTTFLGCNITEDSGATSATYRFGWTGTGQYEMNFQSPPFYQPILRFNGSTEAPVPEAGTLTALTCLLSGGLLILRRRR